LFKIISEFKIDLNSTFVIVHFEETITKIILLLIKRNRLCWLVNLIKA